MTSPKGCTRSSPLTFNSILERDTVGWLKTGDSALKEGIRRKPFRAYFAPYAGNIGILNLPHHGSIHNFHEEFIDLAHLKVAVVTTVPSEERVARVSETIELATRALLTAHVADSQRSSTLKTIVGRNLAKQRRP